MALGRRKVLVIGGAGYIGSHSCKALARAGYEPICYDNLVHGHRSAVRWGPLDIGDVADNQRLGEVFKRYRPEAVLHFAAFAYVGESVIDPYKYYANNVCGSLALFKAAIDAGVCKVVFSSSCAVYGILSATPITEAADKAPVNPYGASKLMVERILKDFDSAFGLRSVSLRYFNAAGADPDGEIGEDHDPETHLLPLILDVAARRRERITIFGTDYDTPDGTCVRDYIHVSDLADAHVRALEYLLAGGKTTAYNLGNGRGFSVLEVIRAAEEIAGCAISTNVGARRPGDPPCLVGCADLIRSELNWEPRLGDLESIVRTAWAWHRNLRC